MNIQTVIANLINTIESMKELLNRYLNPAYPDQAVAGRMAAILEMNLDELNAILADCMAVREADIIKDSEIKELQRQNSDYSWQVNPDRMGQ